MFLPNKPGQLSKFFEFMMKNNIKILSLTVAESDKFGLLLMLVDTFDVCLDLLEKNEYLYTVTEVIAIKLNDIIEGLHKISTLFGKSNINIEFIYSTLIQKEIVTLLRVSDNKKALEVLKKNAFKILEE